MVLLLFILLLAGCWDRRELDTLAVISGIGIDLDEETGDVKLTAQIIKAGEVDHYKKKAAAVWVVQSTGETVFDAVRAFTFQSSRKLYFPHNQILIIGKSLAEEVISSYLNFFIRDHETRNTVYLAISEGKAAEVMKIKTDLEKIPVYWDCQTYKR